MLITRILLLQHLPLPGSIGHCATGPDFFWQKASSGREVVKAEKQEQMKIGWLLGVKKTSEPEKGGECGKLDHKIPLVSLVGSSITMF